VTTRATSAWQPRPRTLGLPLLVKAVAGGGGRGMRLVRQGELADALAGARREALSAFGDGTLMLERLIDDGRHIEIQVFCDTTATPCTWASATAPRSAGGRR
jgi:acetyl/propionyl-CoA carboxylase alpha subunit